MRRKEGVGVICFSGSRKFFQLFILLVTFFLGTNVSYAAFKKSLEEIRAAEAYRYTVKILMKGTLDGEEAAFSGSGIVASLKDGQIFTNQHVIKEAGMKNEKITIQINTESGLPEEIEAEIAFKSQVYDFAILKFDPSKLKRAKSFVTKAKFPTAKQYLACISQGAAVMVYGNPFGIRNNATFGKITSRSIGSDWEISKELSWPEETWIMSDAAISSGNSGGPLVHLQSGLVVGLTTKSVTDGQNLNLTLPILPLLEEWERTQIAERKNYIAVRMRTFDKKYLAHEGLMELVESRIPRFSEFYSQFLMVQSADPSSSLQSGDIILTIKGDAIGDNIEKYRRLVHEADDGKLSFEVIRNKQIINLQVPVTDLLEAKKARSAQFVSVSGMIVQEMTIEEKVDLFRSGGVIVTQIIADSLAAEQPSEMKVPESSVITAIQIDGTVHTVKNLAEFKAAVADAKSGSVIRLIVHEPLDIKKDKDESDEEVQKRIRLNQNERVIYLPIDVVITDTTKEDLSAPKPCGEALEAIAKKRT
ncbi:MAG: protease Do [Bacteriovoracaceae bacterium]|nr:protease Do [Bacteriovoracaceae bacterium]